MGRQENQYNKITCDACGRTLSEAEIEAEVENGVCCGQCRSFYVPCENCKTLIHVEDAKESLCQICFENYYTVCGCCQAYTPRDILEWCQDIEEWTCKNCGHDSHSNHPKDSLESLGLETYFF